MITNPVIGVGDNSPLPAAARTLLTLRTPIRSYAVFGADPRCRFRTKLVRRGMAMAKSGVKPLIFLIAVSVMAWVAGMAIHGF